jgi:hypothetical protein
MELIRYDCEEWDLEPDPIIEPKYSSIYMVGLVKRRRKYDLSGALLKWVKQRPLAN